MWQRARSGDNFYMIKCNEGCTGIVTLLLWKNHYGIKLAKEHIPGGRITLWYPGNVSQFESDIILTYLDGENISFAIYRGPTNICTLCKCWHKVQMCVLPL